MNVFLLNGLWQGALITALALLVTSLVPQRNATTRYAVWFSALIALALVPFATLWHPAQPLATMPAPLETTAIATATVTANAATAGATWLLAGWAIGVCACLVRLALSQARIHRILSNAVPTFDYSERVLLSDDISVPIAAGFFTPAIIVPKHLAESLERGDLESIVRHERAHIARMDILGNLIQRIIEAALWVNPWVYVIGLQLVKEREAACDDWAVHASGEPDRYASCLAHVAQSAQRRRTPLLTPSAIGSKRMLLGRIARLLNGKVSVLKVNYVVLGASVLSFGALALLLLTTSGVAAPTSAAPTFLKAPVASAPADRCNHDVFVVKPVPPDYPDSARNHALAPTFAVIDVTVAATGTPIKATIYKSSKNNALDLSASRAAVHSTYAPAMHNCKAVASHFLFRAEFNPN